MSNIDFFGGFFLIFGLISMLFGKIMNKKGAWGISIFLCLIGLLLFLINSLFQGVLRDFLARLNFSKILLGMALLVIISLLINIDDKLKAIKEELKLLNALKKENAATNSTLINKKK